MKYTVYDENYVQVIVTDKQLEEANIKNGAELPIEIITAMGASHNNKYVPRLHEALHNTKKRIRIEAIYSILSLNDIASIEMLEEKENKLSEDDFNASVSEKKILQSVIIRLKYGAEGASKAFFCGDYIPIVKSGLLYNYSSNIRLTTEDVIFIINALEAYVNKSESWIKAMKKDFYDDVIIVGLEGLLTATEQGSFLNELENDINQKLVIVGSKILQMKIDSYAKELIAEFSKYLPPKYAFRMLEPLMNGHARGDVRKELEKSVNILHEKERE